MNGCSFILVASSISREALVISPDWPFKDDRTDGGGLSFAIIISSSADIPLEVELIFSVCLLLSRGLLSWTTSMGLLLQSPIQEAFASRSWSLSDPGFDWHSSPNRLYSIRFSRGCSQSNPSVLVGMTQYVFVSLLWLAPRWSPIQSFVYLLPMQVDESSKTRDWGHVRIETWPIMLEIAVALLDKYFYQMVIFSAQRLWPSKNLQINIPRTAWS